mgnify:CR=1 FL=1|tara:strand:+ start:205 stop:378 length:174 start_codon:yes stop_codon:yes gene_type:complete
MKIKIEATFELTETDVEVLRARYEELGEDGETFRDYVKSSMIGNAFSFIDESHGVYG